MAIAHAERMASKDRVDELGFIADCIQDVFDGWLSIEHRDIWEKVNYEKAKEETLPGTFVSDDMMSLMNDLLASGL